MHTLHILTKADNKCSGPIGRAMYQALVALLVAPCAVNRHVDIVNRRVDIFNRRVDVVA